MSQSLVAEVVEVEEEEEEEVEDPLVTLMEVEEHSMQLLLTPKSWQPKASVRLSFIIHKKPDLVAQPTQFETYYYATMIRGQMGRNLSRSDLRTKLAGN